MGNRSVFLGLALVGGTVGPSWAQQEGDRGYPPARFDLVSNRRDANGLLLNPRWGVQTDAASLDPAKTCGILGMHGSAGFRSVLLRDTSCFSDSTKALLRLFEAQSLVAGGAACTQAIEDGSPGGHLNWFPITMTGRLEWGGSLGGNGGDFDLTFNLFGDRHPPATRWNDKKRISKDSIETAVHLEFDFRETTDRLPASTGSAWWSRLKANARRRKPAAADSVTALLGPGRAVVSGLHGLDLVHGGHAELHPVFAMAILVDERPTINGGDTTKINQRWVFLVRDRGNEGNCAPSGSIPFRLLEGPNDRNTYTFSLGAPERAAGKPKVGRTWFGRSNPRLGGPRLGWGADHGLTASFSWPQPDSTRAESVGLAEMDLEWTLGSRDSAAARAINREDKPLGGSMVMSVAQQKLDARQAAKKPQLTHDEGKDPVLQPRLTFDAEYYPRLAPIVDYDEGTLDIASTSRPDDRDHDHAPVPARATELFARTPSVVACWQVRVAENPRCQGDWTMAPSVGAIVLRDGGWTAGFSFENPRFYIGGPVARIRIVSVQFASINDPGSAAGNRRRYLVTLQPAMVVLGPVRKFADIYFPFAPLVVGVERSHEDDWALRYVGMGGIGVAIRKGYKVNFNIEALYQWRTGPRGHHSLFGVGVLAPWYF